MKLTEEEKRVRDRNTDAKYRENNQESIRAKNREWKKNNPEKVKEQKRRYKLKNLEKINKKRREKQRLFNADRMKEWKRNNPDKVKKQKQREILNCSNSYVATRLGSNLQECSKELIELKREAIIIGRMTKELNKLIKEKQDGNK